MIFSEMLVFRGAEKWRQLASMKEDTIVYLWDDGNESVERGKLMKDGGAIAGAERPKVDMSSWVL